MALAHVSIPVKNYASAKEFYTKALDALDYAVGMSFDDDKAAGFKSPEGNTDFWIVEKEFAPTHVAFLAPSKEKVDAFYKAAMEAGAKDNGLPGPRPDYGPNYYAAFFLDQDGNNIEACYFGE